MSTMTQELAIFVNGFSWAIRQDVAIGITIISYSYEMMY